MKFTNLKIQVVFRILLLGLAVGIVYHVFQGRVLGKGYPDNSFLYLPRLQFTDYAVMRAAQDPNPYSSPAVYFPFTFVGLRPFARLPFALFAAVTMTGAWWCLYQILRSGEFSTARAAEGAVILLGGAYPIWFCLDRGNIEIGMLVLTCGYLLMVRKRRYWASLAFLVPAMCFKLYPAVFLALLCRRGRLKYAAAAGGLFLIITMGSLMMFDLPWHEELKLWQGHLAKYRTLYVVGNGTMAGSASLWNPAKLGVYALFKDPAAAFSQSMRGDVSITHDVERALRLYSLLMLALAAAITWHISVVEVEFWRKVVLLGLFMIMSSPGGADYKLVYLSVLLAAAIVLRSRRRFDLTVVVLLALAVIPKKYWFFPQFITDSGTRDAPIGMLLNPLLMLVAAALLCYEGWRRSTARGRALRWAHMRTALAWWPPAQLEKSLPAAANARQSPRKPAARRNGRKGGMKRFLAIALLGGIAALLGFILYKSSLQLAASRIYQVDECQNVFMARVLATGQAENYFAGVSLFLVPLVWLAGGASQSEDIFASARIISLLIFWLNLLLIALATGEKLLSRRGLIAVACAVTLAPLWDFGFEVRPENLLLTGLLLTWCAVRAGNAGMPSYLIAGALAVAMQFTAQEAFLYTLPLTFAMLICPPLGGRIPRWKLALAWATGALGMFLAVRVLYGATGLWNAYLAGSPLASWTDISGESFERWKILGRLLGQTPLLLALLAAASAAVGMDLRRRGRTALSWESHLPEALLFLLALAVMVLNPKPHPQSLVILVPFAYLFTFRYVLTVWKDVWALPLARPWIFTLLLFAHFVPFLAATRRHLNWPNHRQELLARLAEELTDPTKDSVYDGIGMVPTRSSIDFHWLLRDASKETAPHLRDKLAARPPAVLIRSYRTDRLPDEDHEFIRDRYVPLADDFWVLGKLLPPGGGEFEIYHPGRYHIDPKAESNLTGTYEDTFKAMIEARGKTAVALDFVATLDGLPLTLTNRTVELTVGTHRIETTADCVPAVVWAGPRLKQVPRIEEGNHLRLFVNWY